MYLVVAQAVVGLLYAQRITNVHVQQEDSTIVIDYHLTRKANIKVEVWDDEMQCFRKMFFVDGDVGKRVPAGDRKLVWDIFEDIEEDYIYKSLQFRLKAQPYYKTFILAYGGASITHNFNGITTHILYPIGGLMIGGARYMGWYLKAQSSFTEFNVYDEIVWHDERDDYIDSQHQAEYMVIGGLIVRLGCPLHFYFGAGYGRHDTYKKTSNGLLIKDGSLSPQEVALDIGFLFNINSSFASAYAACFSL